MAKLKVLGALLSVVDKILIRIPLSSDGASCGKLTSEA
jgi:hypothetical protein